MPSLLERPPSPPKRPRRQRVSLLSENPDVRSLQVGAVLTIIVWCLFVWLFFVALKHLGHTSNKVYPKPKPSFDIQLAPDEFVIPQKQPPPNKFVETNPDAPENIPDKTKNFASRNQQVAQEKPQTNAHNDTPQLEGKKDREVTQIVSGALHQPQQQPPPEPPQLLRPAVQPTQKKAEPRREQNPLPGEQKVEGKDAEGIGTSDSRATENISEVREKVTGQKDSKALEGDPEASTPRIDPQRPQPRRHLERNVRPAVLQQNLVGTSNIGPLAIDAKWSAYGEYLQRMIETIQVEWERVIDATHIQPPSGTEVTVRFRMDSDGAITEILETKSNGGSQAEGACKTGITARAPYGKWSEDMIAVLGHSQDMTFVFYYQ